MDKEYFIELNEVKNRGTWSEQAAVLNDNFRKIQVAEAAVEELAEEVEGYKTLLDSKSMEIGATAFDAIPTKGSVNPVTSDGLHRTTVMAERVIGNPTGDWDKGTAEAYIDKEIAKVKNWVSNTPVTDVVVVETLPASGKKNTLYRVKGTNAYSEYGWDGSKFVLLAVKDYGIDEEPIAGSENLVKSGGVKKELDFSIKNFNSLDTEWAVIKNNVFVFGGNNLGGIEKSANYSISIGLIPSNAKNVSIIGDFIHSVFFYNDIDASHNSYITHSNNREDVNIPKGARLLGINIENEKFDGQPILVKWGDIYNGNESFVAINNLLSHATIPCAPAYILRKHVCAWGGEDKGRIYSHSSYDVVIMPIQEGNKFLRISEDLADTGNLFFFSNKPIIDDYAESYHYMKHLVAEKGAYYAIPDGACYVAFNLDAKDNREPVYIEYEEMRDVLFDIAGYLSSNKSSAYILKNHVCVWGGPVIGKIEYNDAYDVAIIAVEEGRTSVKYTGSVCTHLFSYSDYPAIEKDIEGYNFISQQGGGNLVSDEYYNLPTGAKFIAFNIKRVEGEESNIIISFADNNGNINRDFKTIAKTVVANSVGIFDAVKTRLEDVYVNLIGDSHFAFINTNSSDPLGVSAVPPTCDRTANANRLWNAIKWGNAIYRRFDYGKATLLSGYDDSFSDDSQASFIESGTFKTEYIGAKMREAFPSNDGRVQVSTKCDIGSFPYQFDNSEDLWWQRNIPKRFSNEANAFIQFTIPAGYSKFDFIYHAHIHGDVVTVTTNRANGVVKYSTKHNDWDNAVEANGTTHDLSMTGKIHSNWGNDTFGIPNMRLHFKIEDTSVDTVVTITKSSDATKYLIYWGVTYWGTEALPYALHISNMAVGGYSFNNAWMLVHSLIRFVPTDAIVMEIFANTVSSQPFTSQARSVETYLEYFKSYFDEMNISLDKVGLWLPHNRVTAYQNYPEEVKCTMKYAERIAKELGYNVIANARKLCDDINTAYYPDLDGAEFMRLLGGDGVHLGDDGHKVYSAMWESLR